MRRVLIIAVAAASLVSVQTAALAQNAENPNDQRSKCEKRWDAMVSANQTQGISRDEYLRKCTKGGYWWGGSAAGSNYVPEFALLGLAGVGLGVGLSTGGNNNHTPVSP